MCLHFLKDFTCNSKSSYHVYWFDKQTKDTFHLFATLVIILVCKFRRNYFCVHLKFIGLQELKLCLTFWLTDFLLTSNNLLKTLRQISDQSYELTQTSPLTISPSSFTPKWKRCSLSNPMLFHPLPRTSLPISTPNTIHLSRLTVCLPDSLDLDRCLSILFSLSTCE